MAKIPNRRSLVSDEDKTRNDLLEEILSLRHRLTILGPRKDEDNSEGATSLLDVKSRHTEGLSQEEKLLFTKFSVEVAADEVFWMRDDSKIIYVNDSACKRLGYTHDEMLQMYVWDWDPLFPKEVWPGFMQEMKEKRSMVFETKHRTKNGEVFPVEISARLLEYSGREYLFAFVKDITEGKKAEEALSQAYNELRQIFNAAGDAMRVIDTDFNIIRANDRYLNFVKLTKEEVSEKKCHELLGCNHCNTPQCCLTRVSNGEERFESELESSGADGRRVFLLITSAALRNPSGDLIGVVQNIKDMTGRKQAEAAKASMETQLRQAQKMEAVGTLAGGIAHDFNNILGVIFGHAEMAKGEAPPETGLAKHLDKLLIAAHRAKDLVQQILAFSRQAKVEQIPIRVQPLIKEGLKMLRASIPTTISIMEDIDRDTRPILADPTQMHQILMNLCTNAYHSMELVGGVLSVSLKNVVVDEEQKEVVVPPGEYVQLAVTDTGVGIEQKIIDKIFDPYFTTKETGKGTGMGLAIIHGIVKEYGGTITVRSQVGRGSTFTVYFPVAREEVTDESPTLQDLERGNERILLVDDETMLAKVGQSMLERLGYRVTVRHSSLEALTTFQNTPNDFDLVITDQTMPVITGSDLACRILEIRRDIPIILCTGYSNLLDEESAKALGIKEFALKPLTQEVLSRLVRKVLDGS